MHKPREYGREPKARSDRNGMLPMGSADLRNFGIFIRLVGKIADHLEHQRTHRFVMSSLEHKCPSGVDDVIARERNVYPAMKLRR